LRETARGAGWALCFSSHRQFVARSRLISSGIRVAGIALAVITLSAVVVGIAVLARRYTATSMVAARGAATVGVHLHLDRHRSADHAADIERRCVGRYRHDRRMHLTCCC
jgi:hypothetical protein